MALRYWLVDESPKRLGEDYPAIPTISCCSNGTTTTLHGELPDLLARYNVNDYAASVKVYAVKPS